MYPIAIPVPALNRSANLSPPRQQMLYGRAQQAWPAGYAKFQRLDFQKRGRTSYFDQFVQETQDNQLIVVENRQLAEVSVFYREASRITNRILRRLTAHIFADVIEVMQQQSLSKGERQRKSIFEAQLATFEAVQKEVIDDALRLDSKTSNMMFRLQCGLDNRTRAYLNMGELDEELFAPEVPASFNRNKYKKNIAPEDRPIYYFTPGLHQLNFQTITPNKWPASQFRDGAQFTIPRQISTERIRKMGDALNMLQEPFWQNYLEIVEFLKAVDCYLNFDMRDQFVSDEQASHPSSDLTLDITAANFVLKARQLAVYASHKFTIPEIYPNDEKMLYVLDHLPDEQFVVLDPSSRHYLEHENPAHQALVRKNSISDVQLEFNSAAFLQKFAQNYQTLVQIYQLNPVQPFTVPEVQDRSILCIALYDGNALASFDFNRPPSPGKKQSALLFQKLYKELAQTNKNCDLKILTSPNTEAESPPTVNLNWSLYDTTLILRFKNIQKVCYQFQQFHSYLDKLINVDIATFVQAQIDAVFWANISLTSQRKFDQKTKEYIHGLEELAKAYSGGVSLEVLREIKAKAQPHPVLVDILQNQEIQDKARVQNIAFQYVASNLIQRNLGSILEHICESLLKPVFISLIRNIFQEYYAAYMLAGRLVVLDGESKASACRVQKIDQLEGLFEEFEKMVDTLFVPFGQSTVFRTKAFEKTIEVPMIIQVSKDCEEECRRELAVARDIKRRLESGDESCVSLLQNWIESSLPHVEWSYAFLFLELQRAGVKQHQ